MTTRSSTRTALRALALAVFVAAGAGALGAPARAATLADAGWWYRLDPAPPPPYVPEDGLFVEGAPEGPLAVAAVRYTLGENETNPVLELEVAGRGEDTGAPSPPTAPALPGTPTPPPPESPAEPVILACPTGEPWTGAHPGPYEEAPAPDCAAGSVNGQVADDGSTYTFPLGPLQRGTTIDVVLVPGTIDGAPEGANGSTFEVAFEAPNDDSLTTVSGAPPTTAFSPPPTAGGFDPGGSGTSFDPGTGSTGTFDPGRAPAPPVTDPGATEFQPPGPVEAPAEATPEPDDGGIDLDTIALILVAGTVAAGFAVNQRTERPVRSLSRFAPDPPAPAVASSQPARRRGVGRLS